MEYASDLSLYTLAWGAFLKYGVHQKGDCFSLEYYIAPQ